MSKYIIFIHYTLLPIILAVQGPKSVAQKFDLFVYPYSALMVFATITMFVGSFYFLYPRNTVIKYVVPIPQVFYTCLAYVLVFTDAEYVAAYIHTITSVMLIIEVWGVRYGRG